jgi:RNA recognition motif-containing protein
MINIYVGNLPFGAAEAQLQELFSQHGEVAEVQIITDRATGRSRGFGFVKMRDDSAGRQAIEALNGQEMGGRRLVVNEAKPRASTGAGGGGGGGGGRGGDRGDRGDRRSWR